MNRPMPRVTLIVNPAAGRHKHATHMDAVRELLENRGYFVDQIRTSGPGDATQIAYSAAENGTQLVFACGGDGTMHEVLNGLVRWRYQ